MLNKTVNNNTIAENDNINPIIISVFTYLFLF